MDGWDGWSSGQTTSARMVSARQDITIRLCMNKSTSVEEAQSQRWSQHAIKHSDSV